MTDSGKMILKRMTLNTRGKCQQNGQLKENDTQQNDT